MKQESKTEARFKTGETSTISGVYAFDGYTDGSSKPEPQDEERQIPIAKGERFPPIRSAAKACWWRLVTRL